MRRRIIAAASPAALALGIGIGAAPAQAEDLPLCQFADHTAGSDGDCVVGDVGADGVTVVNPEGPAYADAAMVDQDSAAAPVAP